MDNALIFLALMDFSIERYTIDIGKIGFYMLYLYVSKQDNRLSFRYIENI